MKGSPCASCIMLTGPKGLVSQGFSTVGSFVFVGSTEMDDRGTSEIVIQLGCCSLVELLRVGPLSKLFAAF